MKVLMGVPPAYSRWLGNSQLRFDEGDVPARGYGDYFLYSEALG